MAKWIDRNFMSMSTKAKPESEWACLREGYRKEVYARARANPLLSFYDYSYEKINKGADH